MMSMSIQDENDFVLEIQPIIFTDSDEDGSSSSDSVSENSANSPATIRTVSQISFSPSPLQDNRSQNNSSAKRNSSVIKQINEVSDESSKSET